MESIVYTGLFCNRTALPGIVEIDQYGVRRFSPLRYRLAKGAEEFGSMQNN
ncbi:MAG: hypothetical protein LBB48_08395 [Treponema sp.]|nr:hypothetical protein [Treponema sp.]